MEKQQRLPTLSKHPLGLKTVRFDDYEVHAGDIAKFAKYLEHHHNIVSVDVGTYPITDEESELLAAALLRGGNQNILNANIYNDRIFSLRDESSRTIGSLNAMCMHNDQVANELITKMIDTPNQINAEEISKIEHRRFAIEYILEEEYDRDKTEITKLFSVLKPTHVSRTKPTGGPNAPGR